MGTACWVSLVRGPRSLLSLPGLCVQGRGSRRCPGALPPHIPGLQGAGPEGYSCSTGGLTPASQGAPESIATVRRGRDLLSPGGRNAGTAVTLERPDRRRGTPARTRTPATSIQVRI
ncbi:hypothetical protein P7K49_018703 [Saguinus oedipus]|uniref:Uncharacterized protein n=1 Tax=Saguinus oedipus TaxID=9490 RepID=A0ABQ9V6L0_SAGOE|nr:hypothetical protein P7K49_018703 [Saguinus oedipus]